MQGSPVAPFPQPPLPPAPAQGVVAQAPVAITPDQLTGSPQAIYEAMRAKREVLGEYMSRLLNRRENVANRLNDVRVTDVEKQALEQHLQELNGRIIDMEKQLHSADAEVARAAGIPGAAVPESRDLMRDGPPEEMLIVGTVFAGTALIIIAVAFARRLWRGATNVVAKLPSEFESRFTRFEQAIDTMAIEIERVSEGQRFLTKILAEQPKGAIGAGPAQPIETRAGVAEPVRRS